MDDFVHCVVMVLAGGWRAKALGWKEEIWGGKVDEGRMQQMTCGTTPQPTTTDMFAWVGGSASPRHINVTGNEVTSLLELPTDATPASAPVQESRSLQDKNECRTSFINTIRVVMISNHQTFYDKPYCSTSVQLVKILNDRSIYRVHKHFNSCASIL